MTVPRYLRASDLSREYGFTPRYWTRRAVRGEIPGAHQPSGPGGGWLFDRAAFAAWWDRITIDGVE